MLWLLIVVCCYAVLARVEGATLWNGNFNDYQSTADFDSWSFGNPTGSYQAYIYGNGASANGAKISKYLDLSTTNRNPNDASVKQGLRVQIDPTSSWNGQQMLRTELIGQFNQNNIYQGTVYFQFSMKQGTTNQLNAANEHQLVFFEAHFADIKFGGSGGGNLYFTLSDGTSIWSAAFTPNTWHNFALQVDYTNRQVALWHSTGASQLTQVVAPTSTSVSPSDWHIGALRLPLNGAQAQDTEWVYYSGVYINTAIVPFNGGSEDPDYDESGGNSGGGSPGGGSDGAIAAVIIVLLVVGGAIGAAVFMYRKNGSLFGYQLYDGKIRTVENRYSTTPYVKYADSAL